MGLVAEPLLDLTEYDNQVRRVMPKVLSHQKDCHRCG